MDSEMTIHHEDSNKSSHSNHHRDDSDKHSSKDDISQFDPQLSSREMKKIKYYEDIFARMANEDKNPLGGKSSASSSVYSSIKSTKSKIPHSKSYDKKGSSHEYKAESKSSSSNDAIKDSSLADHSDKLIKRHSLKKDFIRTASDSSVSAFRDKLNDGMTKYNLKHNVASDDRLYKVQSLPSVTKKLKKSEPADTKPSAHTTVSSMDNITNNTLGSHKVPLINMDSLSRQKSFMSSIEIPKLKPKIDKTLDSEKEILVQTPIEPSPDVDVTPKPEDSSETKSPLSSDIQMENNTIDEEPNFQTDELTSLKQSEHPDVAIKKSTRGRRVKPKRYSPTTKYPAYDYIETGKVNLDEEYVPDFKFEPEVFDEPKPTMKTRTKSQRGASRKKKQEDNDDIIDDYDKIRSTKESHSVTRSTGKTSKAHKNSIKIEKQDSTTEDIDHIPIETLSTEENNARIITAYEAEKMLNTYFSIGNMDELKVLINNTLSNTTHSNQSKFEVKGTLSGNTLPEKPSVSFLLDPKNITAPTRCEDRPNESSNNDLPKNPLELSFRYRFFKNRLS